MQYHSAQRQLRGLIYSLPGLSMPPGAAYLFVAIQGLMMFERLKPVASANSTTDFNGSDIPSISLICMGLQPADPFILWLRYFNNGALSSIFHSRSAALSRAFIK